MPAATNIAKGLAAYIQELEARARDAERQQRIDAAENAQWRARYGEALYGWALAESTVHELQTRHSIVLGARLRCRECAWTGRTNPYLGTSR